MSNITITSGKILKDNTIIEVEYEKAREDAKPAESSEVYKDPPKQSLIDAFAELDVHSGLLTEQIDNEDELFDIDPHLIQDFHCSSFSISESKKGEGVVLSAQKTLSSGKTFGFNTPLTYFGDDSDSAYPHLPKLQQSIDKAKIELEKYVNGEHAPDVQGKLDLPEDEAKTNKGKKMEAVA